MQDFIGVFARFFAKPRIAVILGFLLLYRFPEAQLLKLATPFLLDPPSEGGLGLTTQQVGIAYGTVGSHRLDARRPAGRLDHLPGRPQARAVAAGGGHACAQHRSLVLALVHPPGLVVVSSLLALEQFGYGLGFYGLPDGHDLSR